MVMKANIKMKIIVLVVIGLLGLLSFNAPACPVEMRTIREVGMKYVNAHSRVLLRGVDDLVLARTYNTSRGDAAFHVFNTPNGFVIIAANDCATPILGFSDEGQFDVGNVPLQLEGYLQDFIRQIEYGIANNLDNDENTIRQWQLVKTTGKLRDNRVGNSVSPLLSTTWDQGCYYNTFCPEPGNYCERVPTGCVATAMAQVMRYWNYPESGNGFHSYTPLFHPEYGEQSVDFSATTYPWSLMPESLTDNSNDAEIEAVATLLYHCGVSVNMDYSPGSSMAGLPAVINALVDYFNYSEIMFLQFNTDDAVFLQMIKDCLNMARPLLYGAGNEQSGHAFVCDGYSSDDLLHFNWGWGGLDDGYYPITALVNGYNNDHYAIFNITPNSNVYQVILFSTPEEAGAVTGAGNYIEGNTCTIAAMANEGYAFAGWYEDGQAVSMSASYTFTVNSNRNIEARFVSGYQITVEYDQIKGSVIGGGVYSEGETCTVMATANDGYVFDKWTEDGVTVSEDARYSFIVSSSRHLVAHFKSYHWLPVTGMEYSMNINGVIVLDGFIPNVATMEIGAFCGEECRGSQFPIYFPPTGDYIVPLNVASNSVEGDVITFKLFDHVAQSEFPIVCSDSVVFESNAVVGTPGNWYAFAFDGAPASENIEFADATVKSICIANWDFYGDGELNYYEAALVSNLGDVFNGNTEITSFEELQYFIGLSTISDNAFNNCSSLTGSLIIPNNVTVIGAHAFSNCSGLTGSLTIPNKVTEIGDHAFERCSGLTGSLTIPESVTSIGIAVFAYCNGFNGSLTMPNSATSIGYYAFGYCSGFVGGLTIPETMTTIGGYAFYNCSGFSGQLVIPRSVTTIGEKAFEGCSGFSGQLVIPESITTIELRAFSWCTGIESLVLPSLMTTIGFQAFFNCPNIASIYIYSSTPPQLVYDCFGMVPLDIPVYVPYGSLAAYQSADGWNEFTNYHEMDCPSFIITATTHPVEGGTVVGTGTYLQGTQCTLTATVNMGFVFLYWTRNGIVVSNNASYSFIVTENSVFVANFVDASGTGIFSVGENTQVVFSQGNLQYQASTNTWRFAENQWDYVGSQNPAYGDPGGTVAGSDNNNISSNYSGWIDLFGWGTSGYHDQMDPYNVNYMPWSISASVVNPDCNYYGYGPSTNMASPNLTGSSANYDWGVYNAISNGGNVGNLWRTPTESEWDYVFNTRNTVSGIRYAKAQVNGVNGVILLPDAWSTAVYSLNNANNSNASFSSNVISATQWTTFENAGAAFLPAAGYRHYDTWSDETEVGSVGSEGSYWSTKSVFSDGDRSYCWSFYNSGNEGSDIYRYFGISVRLVCGVENISCEINASPNPAEGGTVSSGGVYNYGTACTLVATANPGYSFVNWTENGNQVSTDATYSFIVTTDRDLVANFSLPLSIEATAAPSECGMVGGMGEYDYNTTCVLTATPNPGYLFLNWSRNGEIVSYNQNYSFIVTESSAFVANFTDVSGSGVLNGLFSVSEDSHVYFSQGNLQYHANTNIWRLATNQWDYVGAENANISETYAGWIDLFGWGTSGWNSGNSYYQPWDAYNGTGTGYGPRGRYDLTGDYANADWGVYNPISNGGNTAGRWRTLTKSEWDYVFNTRNTESGIRYAKAQVNNVNGVMLLPDDWNPDIYGLNNANNSDASFSSNVISAAQWTSIESAGAVFLPAAGSRNGTSVSYVGNCGAYWSASYSLNYLAYEIQFDTNYLYTDTYWHRCQGMSVRLVCPYESYSYVINVTSNPAEGGMVSGGGTYDYGMTCTLVATANPGYSFMYWTSDGNQVSTDSCYSFVVTMNRELIAHFSPLLTINATANPTEGGTVEGAGEYYYNSSCTLSAVPNQDYQFVNWSRNGVVVSCSATYSFTVTEDMDLEAVFAPLSGVPIGEGDATSFYLPTCSFTHYVLSQQIYTSEEIGGSNIINSISFFNTGTERSRNIDVYMVHTEKSVFESNTDWFTVSEADCKFSGRVTFNKGQWTTIILSIPFDYDGMSNMALIIDDNTGSYYSYSPMYCRVFDASGNQAILINTNINCDPYSPTVYNGTLYNVKNQVIFGMSHYTITAVSADAEMGIVAGGGQYDAGTTCMLTAVANTDYFFTYWTENGVIVSTEPTYVFDVTRNRNLEAHFEHSVTQTSSLATGWNWYAPTVETTIEAIQTALGDNLQAFQSNGGTPSGDIVPGEMYRIQTDAPCTLAVTGLPITTATITINQGENWLGYISAEKTIAEAFANFTPSEGDKVISQDEGFSVFENGEWHGTLETLQPGRGYVYVLNAAEPKTLVIGQ